MLARKVLEDIIFKLVILWMYMYLFLNFFH